jgi:hypothetical protein
VSTGLGVTTLRTRFDDDFVVDGGTALATVNGGITLPVGTGSYFFQFEFGGGIPFGGRSREMTDTRVDAFFYAEAQGGTTITTAGGTPIRVYAGIGPALTVLRIGSSTTAWSDRQALPGISFAAGFEVPVSTRLSVFGEARDIYSPFKTFSSPGGNFQAQENLIMGIFGARLRF